MAIQPTAIVSPEAIIGKNVEIGPYSIIEDNVIIGDDCYIDSHAKICRYTKLGDRCRVYYGAFVGAEPQDHRFKPGIISYTDIGNDTTIREYVTIHRSPFEEARTTIGSNTLLMAFVHIGHDAQIGNHVTIANQTAVSGHVIIEDAAVLSGYVLIHQFCRIGKLAMLGGRTIITQDVAPYTMVAENNFICGPNTVGLRRAGISSEGRTAIRRAIKIFFLRGLSAPNACMEIERESVTPEIRHFLDFVRSTKRGLMSGDPVLIRHIGNPAEELDHYDAD